MPDSISMFCAPCIEITIRSIANRTIGKVLSSIKMPNLRNVSFMVGSPSVENCRYHLYDTRLVEHCNCDECINKLLKSVNTQRNTELVSDLSLCVLCGLLLITCWNLHFNR